MNPKKIPKIDDILNIEFIEKSILHSMTSIAKKYLNAHLILDVGAGEGRSSLPYTRAGFLTVSLDIDKEDLAQGLNKGKITRGMAVRGDGEMLPFRNEVFDIVSSRWFLHEFENATRYLEEMKRVVKAKGEIICVDFCAPTETVKQFLNTCILTDEYVLTKEELTSLLQKRGLAIKKEAWHTVKDNKNADKLKRCLSRRKLKNIQELTYILKMKRERNLIRFCIPAIFISALKK
ncbi:MAG: class I SAM-dependent methyltransferase [Candidatus Bathyarchaeaceae archaeon]